MSADLPGVDRLPDDWFCKGECKERLDMHGDCSCGWGWGRVLAPEQHPTDSDDKETHAED